MIEEEREQERLQEHEDLLEEEENRARERVSRPPSLLQNDPKLELQFKMAFGDGCAALPSLPPGPGQEFIREQEQHRAELVSLRPFSWLS